MRVLFLGWEFPPYLAGGLGVYCYEVTRRLAERGVEVIFAMPDYGDVNVSWMKVIRVPISKRVGPYSASSSKFLPWRWDIYNVVMEYNENLVKAVKDLEFDLIHANDWLTIPAAVKLKMIKRKPLVLVMHTTDIDRNPTRWWEVYNIEKWGMENADIVVAVSNREKSIIVNEYKIPESKVKVVYNGIDVKRFERIMREKRKKKKIVTFIGRLTWQKGVEYFLQAAKLVLEKMEDVLFVIAGTGPDLPRYIDITINLGIYDKVLFLGFVPEDEKLALLRISDVVVCPSVSDPFGIVPLEAAAVGVPVIISKQMGVSEIFSNCFKVDFWDTRLMASRILEILMYRELGDEMGENARKEVKRISWDRTADDLIKIYREVLG